MDTDYSRLEALRLAKDFVGYLPLADRSAEGVAAAAKTFHNFLAPSDQPTYSEDGPVGVGKVDPSRSMPPRFAEGFPVGDQDREEWAKKQEITNTHPSRVYNETTINTTAAPVDETQYYRKGRADALNSIRAAAVGHLNSNHMVSEHDAAEFLLDTLKKLFPDD